MSKIIILIATTVIAINLLYALLPEGNYEKYCKYIFGLILILIFAGTVVKFEISSEILDFNNNVPVFENTKIADVVSEQKEKLVRDNIINMLKSKRFFVKDLIVTIENNELKNVKVNLRDEKNVNEIISLISSYCDINKDVIVVELVSK